MQKSRYYSYYLGGADILGKILSCAVLGLVTLLSGCSSYSDYPENNLKGALIVGEGEVSIFSMASNSNGDSLVYGGIALRDASSVFKFGQLEKTVSGVYSENCSLEGGFFSGYEKCYVTYFIGSVSGVGRWTDVSFFNNAASLHIVENNEGNFMVAGSFNDDSIILGGEAIFNDATSTTFVANVDSNIGFTDVRILSSPDRYSVSSLDILPSGGAVIGGNSTLGSNYSKGVVFIEELKGQFREVVFETSGDDGGHMKSYVNDLDVAEDGQIFVAGEYLVGDGSFDILSFVEKITPSGKTVWTSGALLGEPGDMRKGFRDVLHAVDGGVFVSGSAPGKLTLPDSQFSPSFAITPNFDSYLALPVYSFVGKIDSEGDWEWFNVLDGGDVTLNGIIRGESGGIKVLGIAERYKTISFSGQKMTSFDKGGDIDYVEGELSRCQLWNSCFNIFVAQMDSSGVWGEIYSSGGQSRYGGLDIINSSGGQYIFGSFLGKEEVARDIIDTNYRKSGFVFPLDFFLE